MEEAEEAEEAEQAERAEEAGSSGRPKAALDSVPHTGTRSSDPHRPGGRQQPARPLAAAPEEPRIVWQPRTIIVVSAPGNPGTPSTPGNHRPVRLQSGTGSWRPLPPQDRPMPGPTASLRWPRLIGARPCCPVGWRPAALHGVSVTAAWRRRYPTDCLVPATTCRDGRPGSAATLCFDAGTSAAPHPGSNRTGPGAGPSVSAADP